GPQPTVEGIAPAMIATDQLALAVAARAGHKRSGAVTADIVKGAQDAVPAAHRQQPIARDVTGDPVAGVLRLGLMTDKQPGASEHRVALARPGFRIAVKAGWQGRLHTPQGPQQHPASTGQTVRAVIRAKTAWVAPTAA